MTAFRFDGWGPARAFFLAAAMAAAMIALPCRADRVYQWVDRPAHQNGYSLHGTITTTDAAPLDALLAASEILAWDWSVSEVGPMFNSTQYTMDLGDIRGVRITRSVIELPLASPEHPDLAILQLGRMGPGGHGPASHRIRWQTVYQAPQGLVNHTSTPVFAGDSGYSYWNESPTLAGPTWVLATAVPEPVGVVLCVVGCLGMLAMRHCGRQ